MQGVRLGWVTITAGEVDPHSEVDLTACHDEVQEGVQLGHLYHITMVTQYNISPPFVFSTRPRLANMGNNLHGEVGPPFYQKATYCPNRTPPKIPHPLPYLDAEELDHTRVLVLLLLLLLLRINAVPPLYATRLATHERPC